MNLKWKGIWGSEKKRLAPLNEGGPVQLLNIQIQKLEDENTELRNRLKTVSYFSSTNENILH
jgi:hypothetical protein